MPTLAEYRALMNECYEGAAKVAEAEVILDAKTGRIGTRPGGRKIAAEIRKMKSQ